MAAIAGRILDWLHLEPANESGDLAARLRDSVVIADLEAQARHERVIAREHAEEGRHADAIESLTRAARWERDAEDVKQKWEV